MQGRMKVRCLLLLAVFGSPLLAFAASSVTILTQSSSTTFPIVISKSGSYKLGGDLNVPAGFDGIDINAGDVTLDLDGFTVKGPVTCTGNGATLNCTGSNVGIGIFSSKQNVTVKNGNVRGFGNEGMHVVGNGVNIQDINASENVSTGIEASGIVWRCTASRNGGRGFYLTQGTIKASVAVSNQVEGFNVRGGSVSENTASANGGVGFAIAFTSMSNNVSMSNAGGSTIDFGGNVSASNNNCDGFSC